MKGVAVRTESRPLGRSSLAVSSVGLGTASGTFDEAVSPEPLVEAALAAGITLFDTSVSYGRAEERLAAPLRRRRDDVVVAHKVRAESERDLRSQVERALRLFGWIDVYQVHNLIGLPRALEVLHELRAAGDVRAVGVTHYEPHRLPEVAEAIAAGLVDVVQVPYNPVCRAAREAVLPLAAERGVGVLVLSPLKAGALAGLQPSRHVLDRLGVETWPEAVIGWILADSRVSSALIASRRPERIRATARAARLAFGPEELALVESIAAGATTPEVV
jgi:aryl-alcohol dehydrogenase-like predicted oxidoreductase